MSVNSFGGIPQVKSDRDWQRKLGEVHQSDKS